MLSLYCEPEDLDLCLERAGDDGFSENLEGSKMADNSGGVEVISSGKFGDISLGPAVQGPGNFPKWYPPQAGCDMGLKLNNSLHPGR